MSSMAPPSNGESLRADLKQVARDRGLMSQHHKKSKNEEPV